MKNILNKFAQGRPAQAAQTRAFTLIELLVVIAIISLLTGIGMTSLVGSKAKARDAKRVSDLGNIQLALELYYDRCKQYPSVLDVGAVTNCGTTPDVNLGNYITTIPKPPAGASQIDYDYSYRTVSSTRVGYVIRAKLEKTSEVVKDGVPSDFMTANPLSMIWSTDPVCSSATGSTDYCLGSK